MAEDSSAQPSGSRLTSLVGVALLGLITGAALLLRLYQLGERSLWVDEAMSVVFAAKPLPELFRLLVTDDVHPPLYPLLLHYWMAVAGSGEFAARFPSVLFGVGLVPLIYVTAGRLEAMGERRERASASLVGLVAATVAATSTFYIGYSQEARNYMAVTFMGLLSSYLLLGALADSSWKGWTAYALATAGALYTHYTAFLLLAFHLLFVVFTCRSYRGAWRWWSLALGAVAVSYLPWVGYSLGQLERISDYWPGTLQLESALRTSLLLFVAGGGVERRSMLPLGLGLALLALGLLALLIGGARTRRPQQILFLLLYLAVPSALLLVVAYYRPKFDPRYLLVVTPAFYLLLAWGIAALLRIAASQRAPVMLRVLLPGLGAAALGSLIAVSAAYGEPAKLTHIGDGNARAQEYGDYRSLVAYLEAHSQPGDAVVLLMNSYHPYLYYSKLQLPWYPMEPFDDFDGAGIRLNRMVEQQHRRLWFILWQKEWADPADYVMHLMETQSREVPLNVSFGGIGLRLFELIPGQRFSYYPKVDHKEGELYLGDRMLEFWGWNVSSDRVAAGGSVQFDLHWRPQKKIQGKLKTKVMLVDGETHLWAAVDEMMVSPFYPPSQWKEQEILHDRHLLKVPAGVPPGSYQVWLIVYDENTMKDLPVQGNSGEALGTVIPLGSMAVTATPESAFPPARLPAASTWHLGEGRVELLRSRVSRGSAKPEERVEVELMWRAPVPPAGQLSLRMALLNEKGIPVGERSAPLAPAYPVQRWRPGEPVLSRHWLDLSSLEPGVYRVAVAVAGPQEERLPAFQYAQLSTLEIREPGKPAPPQPGQDRVDPLPEAVSPLADPAASSPRE